MAPSTCLAHELGHQWLAEARFIDAQGRLSSDLLGDEEAHWSYLLGSEASLFYGAEWREDAPGTYSAIRVRRRYSPLDLYLMGFLPPDKVPALTLLRNESVDRHGIVREGDQLAATPERVTIEQLTAAMGPRRPDWRASRRSSGSASSSLSARARSRPRTSSPPSSGSGARSGSTSSR